MKLVRKYDSYDGKVTFYLFMENIVRRYPKMINEDWKFLKYKTTKAKWKAEVQVEQGIIIYSLREGRKLVRT